MHLATGDQRFFVYTDVESLSTLVRLVKIFQYVFILKCRVRLQGQYHTT